MAIASGTWLLDPARSRVSFQHKTMWGLATVKGTIAARKGGGEVHADGSASGSVTLDAASLDTRNLKRDTHLRSAVMFDAETHPEMTFTVHGATVGRDMKVQVNGDLRVRGVSRPQSFTASLADVKADEVTLIAEFTVDRTGYGMNWNMMGMMTGQAAINASFSFIKTTA